jgi:hypothetical protein
MRWIDEVGAYPWVARRRRKILALGQKSGASAAKAVFECDSQASHWAAWVHLMQAWLATRVSTLRSACVASANVTPSRFIIRAMSQARLSAKPRI